MSVEDKPWIFQQLWPILHCRDQTSLTPATPALWKCFNWDRTLKVINFWAIMKAIARLNSTEIENGFMLAWLGNLPKIDQNFQITPTGQNASYVRVNPTYVNVTRLVGITLASEICLGQCQSFYWLHCRVSQAPLASCIDLYCCI